MQMKPRPAVLRDDELFGLSIFLHVSMEEVDHLVAVIGQCSKASESFATDIFAPDITNPCARLIHRDRGKISSHELGEISLLWLGNDK